MSIINSKLVKPGSILKSSTMIQINGNSMAVLNFESGEEIHYHIEDNISLKEGEWEYTKEGKFTIIQDYTNPVYQEEIQKEIEEFRKNHPKPDLKLLNQHEFEIQKWKDYLIFLLSDINKELEDYIEQISHTLEIDELPSVKQEEELRKIINQINKKQ